MALHSTFLLTIRKNTRDQEKKSFLMILEQEN